MLQSHAGTVVPECFKDDNARQLKSGKFDHRSLKNPSTDRHQNLHGDYVGDPYPYAKFHHDTITTFAPQICENAHQVTRLVFLVLPTAYSQDPCTDFHDQNVK